MKSFFQGKKNLEAEALRPPLQFASPNAPKCDPLRASHASSASSGSPHVEVVKEGDKVVRLIVHCSCGERVEVDCLYAAGS